MPAKNQAGTAVAWMLESFRLSFPEGGELEKMQAETATLAELAKGGDFAVMRAQFGETAKACKACHDKYRNKC